MGLGRCMILKTMQWNIGGAKIRAQGADATDATAFIFDGLEYIANIIQDYQPDIVTLQETHTDANVSQAQELARMCGYSHWSNSVYAKSHLEMGQQLGLGIIANYPIQ